MAYTDYPNQADRFEKDANTIGKQIDKVLDGYRSAKGILSACKSKDLLVSRSLEAIGDISNMITPMKSNISADIMKAHQIATDLEMDAYYLAKQKEEQSDGDSDE